MDMLELQQRANILVEKVNQYEASLEGTTWDENEILNQHRYADLFCLRPVIKLLFGKNLSEKLNRTLDNDVDLKLYASNAPAYITQFDFFVPSNVQTDTGYRATRTNEVEDNKIEMTAGSTNSYIFFPQINSPGEGTSTITNRKFKVKVQLWDEFDTSSSIINLSFIRTSQRYEVLNLTLNKDTSAILLMGNPIINLITPVQPNDIFDIEYDVDYENNRITTCRLTIIHNSTDTYNYTYTFTPYHDGTYYTMCQVDFLETGDYSKYQYPRYVFKDSISCTYTLVDINTNRTSQGHALAANYDMYHDYNMVQLDTYENELETRATRIAHGINYSYSANIYDALITESQVANVFKWNTQSSEVIKNNQVSHNRQVPGIVLYYLGNNYDGTYTATVPYSTDAENINSVNYNYPSIYGAYYMMDNIAQSQVGPDMGHEALKMFVPGLNFFNGKLYSPQQIYQPAKLFGQENLGKGFNYQGSALYHELVFKDKRSDTDIDFSSMDSDIDNDKQGFATRLVLAQQEDYYYNRPWFNELNSLQGQEMCTRLSDNIMNSQGNQTFYELNNNLTEARTLDITYGGSIDYTNNLYQVRLTSSGMRSGLIFDKAPTFNQPIDIYIWFRLNALDVDTDMFSMNSDAGGSAYSSFYVGADNFLHIFTDGSRHPITSVTIKVGVWTCVKVAPTFTDANNYTINYYLVDTNTEEETLIHADTISGLVSPCNMIQFVIANPFRSGANVDIDLAKSNVNGIPFLNQEQVISSNLDFVFSDITDYNTSGLIQTTENYVYNGEPTIDNTKRTFKCKYILNNYTDTAHTQTLVGTNLWNINLDQINGEFGLSTITETLIKSDKSIPMEVGDELELEVEMDINRISATLTVGDKGNLTFIYSTSDLYTGIVRTLLFCRNDEGVQSHATVDLNSLEYKQIGTAILLTDTEFYNNYSVDYNTYKEAIDGI